MKFDEHILQQARTLKTLAGSHNVGGGGGGAQQTYEELPIILKQTHSSSQLPSDAERSNERLPFGSTKNHKASNRIE